jgi:hypothetical protein
MKKLINNLKYILHFIICIPFSFLLFICFLIFSIKYSGKNINRNGECLPSDVPDY